MSTNTQNKFSYKEILNKLQLIFYMKERGFNEASKYKRVRNV